LWEANITKKKQTELDTLFDGKEELKILIMNVEAFSTKKGLDFAQSFLNIFLGRALIGIDESTTIKNPTAKRTKNILTLGNLAKYRRILTGSPVTKSPLDLFSQCKFLDPFHLGYDSYYAYRSRYAHMLERNFGGRRVQIVGSYRRLGELADKLEKFSYRVLKEDCLDLPPKVYTKRVVELSDEQKKAYSTMKEFALAELEKGGLVTAPTVMTQLLRLHQISCGHLTGEDGEIQTFKNNRIKELMNILAETDGKVIIWANYRQDIRNIRQEIEKEYGVDSVSTYFGDTPDKERQEIVKRFQDPDNSLRFFVGNQQTAGYGLTLTAASTVVYYSNNYDLEKRIQSEDRAHRIGQTKSVTYIDLMTEKTVDEKIVKSLRNKIDIAAKVLGEELKEWLT